MELFIEILKVIGLLLSLMITIAIVIGMFSSIGHTPMSEYDLFGEEGADGYEQRMMELTDEEYERFKNGDLSYLRNKEEK